MVLRPTSIRQTQVKVFSQDRRSVLVIGRLIKVDAIWIRPIVKIKIMLGSQKSWFSTFRLVMTFTTVFFLHDGPCCPNCENVPDAEYIRKFFSLVSLFMTLTLIIVCGTDDVSYRNHCELEREACLHPEKELKEGYKKLLFGFEGSFLPNI